MKKLVSFGLMAIVFAAFTFVSCDKEEDNNTETAKTEEPSGNNETTKSNEQKNDDETTKNENTSQNAQKKLLLISSSEHTVDGKKYSYVTEYKYNENGDVIEEETRTNGNLTVTYTDYNYNGNVVSYKSSSYVNGKKSSTDDVKTESKYNDKEQLVEEITYINGKLSSKLTDYKYNGTTVSYIQYSYVNGEKVSTTNVKIERKYNDIGQLITEETYIDGKLATKTTDYKYNGNVVTYIRNYYSNGKVSSTYSCKDTYNY